MFQIDTLGITTANQALLQGFFAALTWLSGRITKAIHKEKSSKLVSILQFFPSDPQI